MVPCRDRVPGAAAGVGPAPAATTSTDPPATAAASRRLARAAAPWAALGLPVAGYLAFIAAYGVNTIVVDQWTDIALLQKVYAGHLTFSALWAAHNENRMLFPNLVVVALAHLDHLDTVVEMYIGAALLAVTAFLVVASHRRHSSVPLGWYLPVPALLFTLAQYYNTLTGFQLAWYMSLAATVAALSLLDRRVPGPWALVCAVALAIVGSYSTIEGLFVWPAGLLLMLLRRRQWRYVGAWAASGVVVSVLYFVNLASGGAQFDRFDVRHPGTVAGFLLLLLGDPSGVDAGAHVDAKAVLLMVAGGVVLAASAYALWRTIFGRADQPGPEPWAGALIAVGIAFALATAYGRAFIGLREATASRFVTYEVLPIVGCYLVFLTSSWGPRAAGRAASPSERLGRRAGGPRAGGWAPAAVSVLVLVPAVAGAVNGIAGGRTSAAYARTASDVIVNVDKASDLVVFYDVYPLADPRVVRSLVEVARSHRLSLFDTAQVSLYQHLGLFATAPATSGPPRAGWAPATRTAPG